MRQQLSSWLSLFASTSTLLCCALPSLLVALGMGATMAGIVSTVPQLIWISKYKAWVFLMSGLLISFAALMHYRSRNAPCPIDPIKARACTTARIWSLRILSFSAVIWLTGAFFAFIAPYIL